MEIREYLSQALVLDRAINAELAELESLKRSKKLALTLSEYGGKTYSVTEKICAAEESVNRKIDELIGKKEEIKAVTAATGDEEIRIVFSLRYVSGLTWEEVADRSFMCLRSVYNLHKRGLRLLEQAFGAEIRAKYPGGEARCLSAC